MKVHEYPNLLEVLSTRLQEPLPSKEALAMMFPNIKSMPEHLPDNVRLSAVLLPLFIKNEEWHILVIRRTEDGHAHSGQISFPGGRHEPEDLNLQTTALREAQEEVGISPDKIKTIGALSPVYIVVSNFRVFPYIAYLESPDTWHISPNEVQSVIEIPLSELFDPKAKVQTEVVSPAFPDIRRTVNAYQLQDETIIWGATAIILAELELILKARS